MESTFPVASILTVCTLMIYTVGGNNFNMWQPTPIPSQEGNLPVPMDEFPSWEGVGVGKEK